jgi:hypothetical protein
MMGSAQDAFLDIKPLRMLLEKLPEAAGCSERDTGAKKQLPASALKGKRHGAPV